MDLQETALLCAKIADDNKANDIVILNIAKYLAITDYFVICSGLTTRHVQGISKQIETKLKEHDIRCRGIEGYQQGKWILMDYDEIHRPYLPGGSSRILRTRRSVG